MSTDNTTPPVITFEQAFNQAINSLDLKGTLALTQALVSKAIFMLEEDIKPKSNIIKPVVIL